jgi:hypothetical protein
MCAIHDGAAALRRRTKASSGSPKCRLPLMPSVGRTVQTIEKVLDMNAWYLLVIAWGVIGFGFIPWLFSKSSGWPKVRRLPFRTRMLLAIPFQTRWRSDVDPESLASVEIWRRRSLVWVCFCIGGQAVIWFTLWLRFSV